MKRDKLLEIFNRRLKDLSQPNQTQDDLIFNVVADYIFHLMQIGNVPQQMLDHVETYLKEEVLEIYRKKTYGHHNLYQFRLLKFRVNC